MESKRPKSADPRPKTSAFSYNTPAYSLLPEAVPVSTQIRTGTYSAGSSIKRKHQRHQSAAALLKEACGIEAKGKTGMFDASGGAFGRITAERVSPEVPMKQETFLDGNVGRDTSRYVCLVALRRSTQ